MASKTERKQKEKMPEGYITPIQFSLLEILKENGSMTRDQICEEFGFKKYKREFIQSYPNKKEYKTRHYREVEQYHQRTTIFDNLTKLQKRNLVKKFRKNNGKRGRPPEFWKIMGVEE